MKFFSKAILCITLLVPLQAYGYTLTVKSSGASGVVIFSSNGFFGRTDYSKQIKAGFQEVAKLRAPLSSGGKQFDGWSGCSSTFDLECSVTLSGDRTVTVNYGAPDNYTLTVRSSGVFGVAITSSNGFSGQTDYSKSVTSGDVVNLRAPSSSGGKQFDGWSGCSSTSGFECNVTMDKIRTVTVAYSLPSATPPGVVTNAATNINPDYAFILASINPNGSSTNGWFQYGATTAYGSITFPRSIGSGTSSVSHTAGLKGLNCNTTYNFQAVAQNELGTTYGSNQTFSTLDCAPPPPPLPDPTPGEFQINSGLNSIWYNPSTDGQGFFLTVFPDLKMMFASWYTYDTIRPPSGTPYALGEPGHRWITAQGPYSGNEALLDVYISKGGLFDQAQSVDTLRDGTLHFKFDNCHNATVTYDIPSIGRQGEIPVVLLFGDSDRCQEQATPENQPEARKPEKLSMLEKQKTDSVDNSKLEAQFQITSGLNDAWFNPSTAGQGFFVTAYNGTIVVAWFTYDTFRPPSETPHELGDPGHRWFLTVGNYSGDEAFLEIGFGNGGVFDGDPALVDYQFLNDGTMYIKFDNCESGKVAYDIPSIGQAGEIPIQRIVRDNIAECEAISSSAK